MELREVFEPIVNFLKSLQRKDKDPASKEKAKERLQLVLLQDRASVSPDFFEMMKKEIIEVIKKYIEIDEESLEVQLTRGFEDGDETGPALYANIPIKNIKPVAKKVEENEEELVTEIISHDDIVEEESNTSVQVAENVSVEENQNIETVTSEQVENEVIEVPDEIIETMKQEIQEKVDELVNEKIEVIENSKSENNEDINSDTTDKIENVEIVKEKLNEVKDGVTETLEKVKKGAKEGIKKIKTKTQKKKIKE